MFKQPDDLEPLYDEIVRTAVFTVKPDNIATFLGQRITYNDKISVLLSNQFHNAKITAIPVALQQKNYYI